MTIRLKLVIPDEIVPPMLKELGPLADSRAGREAGINNLLVRCMRDRYSVSASESAGETADDWTRRNGKMAKTARAILAAVDAGIYDRQQILTRLYGPRGKRSKEDVKHADSVATRLRNAGILDGNARPQWKRPPGGAHK